MIKSKYIAVETGTECFLIEQIEKIDGDKEKESRYEIFVPIGLFEINRPGDKYVNMYIPYHLLTGIAIQHRPDYDNPYTATIECETFGTIEDFYSFYSKFKQCEVEKETSSLIVTNKKNQYRMKLTLLQSDNMSKVKFEIL